MKRNTLGRIKRQITQAEAAINELPVELAEAIEHNKELDLVKMMDDLVFVAEMIDFVMDDDNGYALTSLCQDDNPDKKTWHDPIGQKTYAPVVKKD